jgi:thiosulfate/3-mercaptopyruvate sulfurtransferase
MQLPPLVTPAWLAAHLAEVRVIDARWRGSADPGEVRSRALFALGHIPDAVPLDWQFDLAYTDPSGVRARLLPPDRFAVLMDRLGLTPAIPIVAYADRDYSGAARVWWALRYYGFTNVAVLDGGWDAWLAEGRAMEKTGAVGSRAEEPLVTKATVGQARADLLATADEVQRALDAADPMVAFVDSRPREKYEGRAVWTPLGSRYLAPGETTIDIGARGPLRAGRLPGAIHLNSSSNLDRATWMYLPPEVLRARALAAGLRPEQRIITYCGVGISASLTLFALHLAGFPDLALYDGSWEEWSTDPQQPIERSLTA